MNDDAYCAVGCPPEKVCPATTPLFGCAIGTARPHNPDTPFCCEVDANTLFLSTMKRIEIYGNKPDSTALNPGTLPFRQRLRKLSRDLDASWLGPSLFSLDDNRLSIEQDVIETA